MIATSSGRRIMTDRTTASAKDPILPAKPEVEQSEASPKKDSATGQPLPSSVRTSMEQRFGHNFGDVRVHADAEADDAAKSLDADAFTLGKQITFRAGQYAPESPAGQKLLAHELTHVVQQHGAAASVAPKVDGSPHMEAEAGAVSRQLTSNAGPISVNQRAAQPVIQRQKTVPGGGATPGTGEGVDLIFIIRAPDDQYTNDVTAYVKTVLQGQAYAEVDNLDDIVDYLSRLKPKINIVDVVEPAIKVRRIRIVAHGSTTGGIKMTPRGEKARRWVTPDEISKQAQNPLYQQTMAQVMSPGAEIEFWGCNVGAVPKTGEAVSSFFQSSFSAIGDTFKTGFDEFYRRPDKGEAGEFIADLGVKAVRVTNTAEVDSRNKALKNSFRAWLLARYAEFVANGDILPIKDVADQVTYMRDLFNRAGGKLRYIKVDRKSDHKNIRPGDQPNWIKLWHKTNVPAKAGATP
jgi:Domain of unknown function (DUF4157)